MFNAIGIKKSWSHRCITVVFTQFIVYTLWIHVCADAGVPIVPRSPGIYSSGFRGQKLKTSLRLSINRLKLLEKKKTEIAQESRREIADYLVHSKVERARIRVEHIIREDYYVEVCELVEMYCDLLLARFGLIETMDIVDEALEEAVCSLLWVAPTMQTDVQELSTVAQQLTAKFGNEYAQACRSDQTGTVNERMKLKVSGSVVEGPSKILVERYLIEIAKNFNVAFEPDPMILAEELIIGGPPAYSGYPPLPADGDLNIGGPPANGGYTLLPAAPPYSANDPAYLPPQFNGPPQQPQGPPSEEDVDDQINKIIQLFEELNKPKKKYM